MCLPERPSFKLPSGPNWARPALPIPQPRPALPQIEHGQAPVGENNTSESWLMFAVISMLALAFFGIFWFLFGWYMQLPLWVISIGIFIPFILGFIIYCCVFCCILSWRINIGYIP